MKKICECHHRSRENHVQFILLVNDGDDLRTIHSQITSLSSNLHFTLRNHPALSRISLSIPGNFDLNSIVIERSDSHSAKHPLPKISTDEGRMISIKSVLKNDSFSIRDNLDPDSNGTEESDLQEEKHLSRQNSTDNGRMISIKPVPPNAHFSVPESLDSDSNITEESDLHELWQSLSRSSDFQMSPSAPTVSSQHNSHFILFLS
jgi:hypothetical protein